MDFIPEDFSSYTILNINPTCYLVYPCKHDVEVKFNNCIINITLSGLTIAEYYKYHKYDIPLHFNEYISLHAGRN
jgi:hypothetical protein